MFGFKKRNDSSASSGSESQMKDFAIWRRRLLRSSIYYLLTTFVSAAIVGLKLLYPFHLVIGFAVYFGSFVLLFRRIYLSRREWKKYKQYKFATSFLIKEKIRIILMVVLVVVVALFLWVRPLDEKPFEGLDNTQIQVLVADDLYKSVSAMDYLETTGNTLLATLESKKEDANTTELISKDFEEFLKAVAFSEALTDDHRYFASIPYSLWNERITSFLMSYSLYVKKYELVHRIMTKVSGNEYQKKAMNQYVPYTGRGNVYNEMVVRFYEPKTRIRLSGGYLYMLTFSQPNQERVGSFELLYDKSRGSYKYLFSHFFATIVHTGEMFVDNTELKMFDKWFPIQKTVANTMGHAILTNRGKDGFITHEQALEMGRAMNPGDIMLQRRNWHLSNVGIPGFWTHAALYTGELDKMDKYFASEFPYSGYSSMSELMKDKYPKVYEKYSTKDVEGFYPAVAEAIEPGVVLQSIPKSADADFVVALRPRLLNKKDNMLAIIKTFEHVGKPYDYNFDFDTRDALVCSELVFDALFERPPEKNGLHFKTSLVNGRKIVSPLDMANKFVAEYGKEDAELSFVYFLKGNEKTKKSYVSTEAEFMKSINWSKFSFFQE